MRQPGRFTSAVSFSTPVMSVAYLALGAIGYWSQGMGVQEIIIFGTGYDTWSRVAAGAILFQVCTIFAALAPPHIPYFSFGYAMAIVGRRHYALGVQSVRVIGAARVMFRHWLCCRN